MLTGNTGAPCITERAFAGAIDVEDGTQRR